MMKLLSRHFSTAKAASPLLRPFSTAKAHTASHTASSWSSCVDTAGISAAKPYRTHDVHNQVPSLTDYSAFLCDPSLTSAVDTHGGGWAGEELKRLGACVGSSDWQEQARLANAHPPVLRTHDRHGRHIDVVDYHPSYHALQRLAIEEGVAGFAWKNSHKSGAMVARSALQYLMYQLEPGVVCPTTMTFAATPAIAASGADAVSETWLPLLSSQRYNPEDVPISEKDGVIVGMSMTEKQGGSDVRANTTFATPVHASSTDPGDQFTLVGHKWFTSAPMSDAFLTLAQTRGTDGKTGVSCFLVPRWLPDGTRNSGLRVVRLKEKIGDRSNASSEVE